MNLYELIRDKFILPYAQEDWSSYRTEITRHIIQLAARIPHPDIVILGAGRCNDIDLTMCAEVCDHITLIDEDGAAMQEAVALIESKYRNQIQTCENSLTGLTSDDIRLLCDTIFEYAGNQGQALSPEEYLAFVTLHLAHLRNSLYSSAADLSPILPPSSYDLVVCLGVHSQLFSMLAYCLETLDYNISQQLFQGGYSGIHAFHAILDDMVHQTIPVLNSAILDAARAYAVIGCEYNARNPITGAYHSIQDIRNRPLDPSQVTESHILWNFNPAQRICYDMLIQTISTTV